MCCGEPTIHQANRKGTESSSAYGQLIQKFLNRKFAAADLDIAVERTRDGKTLWRAIEHKQPGHKFDGPQQQLLRKLAEIIRAVRAQKDFRFSDGTLLAHGSGAFVVRCEVTPEITIKGDVEVTELGTERSTVQTPYEHLLWLPSRNDERGRDHEWQLREFIKWNQRETLGIEHI